MTENRRNAMVLASPYLQNEFGDPRIFSRFLSNLIIFYRQSKFKKKSVRGKFLGANVLKVTAPNATYLTFIVYQIQYLTLLLISPAEFSMHALNKYH